MTLIYICVHVVHGEYDGFFFFSPHPEQWQSTTQPTPPHTTTTTTTTTVIGDNMEEHEEEVGLRVGIGCIGIHLTMLQDNHIFLPSSYSQNELVRLLTSLIQQQQRTTRGSFFDTSNRQKEKTSVWIKKRKQVLQVVFGLIFLGI